MSLDPLLGQIRAELRAEAGLEVAFLFGSVARGRATASSDVDIAVKGAVDPLALAGRLSLVLGREVDVVMIDNASIPLTDAILRDGVVVFERSRGAAALLRSRLLAALETDRPWYDRMQTAWLARIASRGVLG